MDPKINLVIPFPAQNTLKKVAGIYAIVNLVNNKQYIGSTENLRFRFNAHKRLLREQKHHSYKLQRAYNKYGEGCFEFRRLL